VQLLKRR